MGNSNVLTGPTAPVSIPNPVAGVLMGRLGGIPQPETVLDLFNATFIPMLLGTLLQQKYSPDTKSSFKNEYDYIIVGAGAAGCVLANRLSEKSCKTVLLLEAGKTPPVLTEIPGIAMLLRITDTNWNYWTEPQEYTGGWQYQNRIPFDCGKGLGGSSLINAMLYSRGNKHDYDEWEEMGAKGWSYKAVLPYFLKLENNTDMDLASNHRCHNVSGPMTFSRPRYTSYLRDAILRGAKSLGYDVVDSNCENQLGMADFQTFIRHGQRCSAAKAYLVPVDDRPNLDIVTGAYVTKIQISNKTAQGVCFDYKGSSHCVRAKREVILSAGAINSPKILMHSGVGPRETLEKFKIPVHADLPVGHNLQDHVTTPLIFSVTPAIPYLLNVISPVSVEQYLTDRSGPLASPTAIFSVGYHRSPDAVTAEGVPNFESYFVEGDNGIAKLTFGINPLIAEKVFLPYEASATMWCISSVLHPKARGFVSINSTNPYDDPIIDPKFLSDPQDIVDLVAGLKFCLQIVDTEEVKKAGVELFKTKMPGCEDYFDDDIDQYLKCYASKVTISFWHQSCTVKMGCKTDPTVVVDPKFRVKGIKKLRVIDASTMPKVVSGNTMTPTMMMAEKGSDIIKKTIRCC